jgi:hypothetical protein
MEPDFPDDDSLLLDGRCYESALKLSEQYGMSEKYLVRLAIESKVEGQFLSGNWYIRYDSLDRYLGDRLEAYWRSEEERRRIKKRRCRDGQRISRHLFPRR